MNLRVTFSFQNGNLFCYICRFTNFLYTYVYLPTYVVGVFHKQVKNYSRFILTSVRNCLHDGYLKVELYMVHIYVLIVIDLAGIPNLSFSRGNHQIFQKKREQKMKKNFVQVDFNINTHLWLISVI